MTHADDARRIVDAMKTCQTHHPEKWLEPIAAALAAADATARAEGYAAGGRAGIERAVTRVEDIAKSLRGEMKDAAAAKDIILASHLSSGLDVLKAAATEIRALLPAAVAEPAAKCAHKWANMRNIERGGSVESGFACLKCGALAAKCPTCLGTGNVGEYGPPGGPYIPCPTCAAGGGA